MVSIGDRLAKSGGFGPGFDFLRIALAFGVVFVHAESVATGRNVQSSRILWLPEYSILVMFFALSGFLIAGSAQRLSLGNFMLNRGLRILPALAIEIALSAMVLGAIFTKLSLQEYYSNRQTWHYFTNIFGLINYYLPGVFQNNPKTAVNWSLWTVPYEFGCYAIIGILMLLKVLRYPAIILIIIAALLVFGFLGIAPNFFGGNGAKLYISFLLGIVAYLYRDRLPYDARLFAGCCIVFGAIDLFRPAPWITPSLLNLTVTPIAVYMMIFVGHSRIPKLPIYGRGDYSYGVYLYGNPIQQAVRAALPWTNTAALNLLFSIPLITMFAMFSWHYLEKPVLRQRRRFSFVARARGVEGPGESLVGAPPALAEAVPNRAV